LGFGAFVEEPDAPPDPLAAASAAGLQQIIRLTHVSKFRSNGHSIRSIAHKVKKLPNTVLRLLKNNQGWVVNVIQLKHELPKPPKIHFCRLCQS
jgi:hypothetical protein